MARSRKCCCYHGCDPKDDRWHQHEDEPCPVHPDAPVLGTKLPKEDPDAT